MVDEDKDAQKGNEREHTDPVQHQEAPEWAKRLQATMEELPSRLKASVTDDDKSGIAEAVHGLFERSGAFEAREEKKEEAGEEEHKDKQPAKKESGSSTFAQRHFGG